MSDKRFSAYNSSGELAPQSGADYYSSASSDEFVYFPSVQPVNDSGQQSSKKAGNSSRNSNDKQKKQSVKKIQKRVNETAKKDPFIKNRILKRDARSKLDNPLVRLSYTRFVDQDKKRKEIAHRLSKTRRPEKAKKLEEEFQKEEKKQTQIGRELKVSMLTEDLKRAIEGPAGWAKYLKGCFMPAMICLTLIGGSVIGAILLAVL